MSRRPHAAPAAAGTGPDSTRPGAAPAAAGTGLEPGRPGGNRCRAARPPGGERPTAVGGSAGPCRAARAGGRAGNPTWSPVNSLALISALKSAIGLLVARQPVSGQFGPGGPVRSGGGGIALWTPAASRSFNPATSSRYDFRRHSRLARAPIYATFTKICDTRSVYRRELANHYAIPRFFPRFPTLPPGE